VLDGIHRCRIARELDIHVPVSQMGQLTEQEKLQLAVGVNVRRRHMDADRRRDLVLKLRDEQGLTVRDIAAITGWSKSTVGRDLTPPAPPTAEEDRLIPVDELLERWYREHPQPAPGDFYSDENDHLGKARHALACVDWYRDRTVHLYEYALEWAAPMAEHPPHGTACVTLAASGIRFHTAARKAERKGSTEEDYTEAQQAWLAYVAAMDTVAALDGKPYGDERSIQFEDYLYHPAYAEALTEEAGD
jgi:hypothetical protein